MCKAPFFSICIPTYNSVIFLKKLVNSLELQDFKNFEIIISDDSTTDDVFIYVSEINDIIKNISYYKRGGDGNATINWNTALSFAKGEYKILIHHDDYFLIDNSLNEIYMKIIENDYIEEQDGALTVFEFKWNPDAKHKIPKLFLETYPGSEFKIIHRDNLEEFLT